MFSQAIRNGSGQFVVLCLLVEVYPDAGRGQGMSGGGLVDVRNWDHLLVVIQEVVQLQHGQKVGDLKSKTYS